MTPRIKNLIYYTIFGLFLAGVTYFVLYQIQSYKVQLDIEAVQGVLAQHKQPVKLPPASVPKKR